MKQIMAFDLSSELTYTKDGDPNCKTATLFLLPPSMNNLKYTSKLSQMVIKSLTSAMSSIKNIIDVAEAINEKIKTQQEENKDKEQFNANDFKDYINLGNIELFEYFNCFTEFILNKNCFLDENLKIKLTGSLLDQLDIEDVENMMYTYISNFMKPSMF